jgi:hypothetical protein
MTWKCPLCQTEMPYPPREYNICPGCTKEFGYDASEYDDNGKITWECEMEDRKREISELAGKRSTLDGDVFRDSPPRWLPPLIIILWVVSLLVWGWYGLGR